MHTMMFRLRKTNSFTSFAAVASAALLAACGGGGGGEDLSQGGGTTTSSAGSGVTLTLSNLPSEKTTSGQASIGYSVDAAGAQATVSCRLDSYTPIACPNPFVLGQSAGLAPGVHKVEYFVDTGSGIDLTKPAASYSWTVEGTATASTGSTTTTPATSGTSGGSVAPAAGALAAAPTPASTAVSGYSGQWNGTTISTSGAYMGRVADPNGSGRTVNLHRVTQGGASIWGGVRSEQLWNNHDSTDLVPGKDIWMSFAVQRKADETFPASSSYDTHLVFQTHTPQSGDTQPDIALFATGNGGGTMRWRVAYNTSGNVDGQGWMSTEGNPWVSDADPIAPGQWHRYVVHYRPGYASSHNPLLRVWRAKPGGAYEQIVNHTGYNTYNTSRTGVGPSYPRIGLYKWTSSTWTSNSVAWYLTPLYFGTGADLLEAGKAALSGL